MSTGIGTIWGSDLIGVVGSPEEGCVYGGENANREFQELSGCSEDPVPVSLRNGNCGHWLEACLLEEEMTPFTTPGPDRSSRITIASLEDLGYEVQYDQAEAFTRDDLNATCTCDERRRRLAPETLVDTTGQAKDETLQYAREAGMQFLVENALSRSANPDEEDVIYVGDKVVAVVIEEDGQIFDVTVHADSF